MTRSRTAAETRGPGPLGVAVSFEFGYWLAFLGFVEACVRGILAIRGTRMPSGGEGKASGTTPPS